MDKRLTLPILIMVVLMFSGCYEVINQAEGIKQPQSFDIRVRTGSNYKDNNFTILVRTNGTTIINGPDMTIFFDIKAVAPPGAKKDDYTSLFFSVDGFDTQIFMFNGAYQISWLIDNYTQFYVKGSKSMSYMRQYNFTLNFNFNVYELLRVTFSNTTINFHDEENLWSKQYNVIFVIM
jgi:hypothetical protein